MAIQRPKCENYFFGFPEWLIKLLSWNGLEEPPPFECVKEPDWWKNMEPVIPGDRAWKEPLFFKKRFLRNKLRDALISDSLWERKFREANAELQHIRAREQYDAIVALKRIPTTPCESP